MGKISIPARVRHMAEQCGCNGIRKVLTTDLKFGDVYELYIKDTSSPVPVPTGLPLLVSYRNGSAAEIAVDDAFKILDAIS